MDRMGKRLREKLTAVQVRQAKAPGLYNDGGDLYVRIAPGGSKSWLFRYRFREARRDMGLGGYPTITLAAARELADAARKQIAAGIDPIEVRRLAEAADEAANNLHRRRGLILGRKDLRVIGFHHKGLAARLLAAEAEEGADHGAAVGAIHPLAGRTPFELRRLGRLLQRFACTEECIDIHAVVDRRAVCGLSM
jgi:hypothetical protein